MRLRRPRSGLPPRNALLDLALAAYFVVLAAAPLALAPVLADGSALTYDIALRNVAVAVAMGYVVGLAVLLRLQA